MDALKTIAAALRIEATQQAVDAVRCREVGHHEIAVSADGASRALLAAARILERVGGAADKAGEIRPRSDVAGQTTAVGKDG